MQLCIWHTPLLMTLAGVIHVIVQLQVTRCDCHVCLLKKIRKIRPELVPDQIE